MIESIEELTMRAIISSIDADCKREGLIDTPKRYLSFLREFTKPKIFNFTTFDAEGMDQMIHIKDIPFYSLCEHHMLPFFGVAHVAYIPGERIVGLSKIPRVVDMIANRLQNQERITQQIAQYLVNQLNPRGVAVVLNARHMCMEMRGVQKIGSTTTTSKMMGAFETNINARQEFLNLIK